MLMPYEAFANLSAAVSPLVALSTSDDICIPVVVAGAVGSAILGGAAWMGRKIDRYETWMREDSARKDKLYDELLASVRAKEGGEHGH